MEEQLDDLEGKLQANDDIGRVADVSYFQDELAQANAEIDRLRGEVDNLRMNLQDEQQLRRLAEVKEREAVNELAVTRRVSVQAGLADVELNMRVTDAEKRWLEEADARQKAEDRWREAERRLNDIITDYDEVKAVNGDLKSMLEDLDRQRETGTVTVEVQHVIMVLIMTWY